MSATAESVKMYWVYTLVSLVATLAFLYFKPEWFWVALPFVTTYFVKAMRWM